MTSVFVSIRHCEEVVAAYYDVLPADLRNPKARRDGLVRLRHTAMWLAMQLTSHASGAVGRAFGRDAHAVRDCVEAVERRRATDPAFAAELTELVGIATSSWARIAGIAAPSDLDPVAVALRVVGHVRGATGASIDEVRALALAVLAAADVPTPAQHTPEEAATHG